MKRFGKKVIVLAMAFLVVGGLLYLLGLMLGGRQVAFWADWGGQRPIAAESSEPFSDTVNFDPFQTLTIDVSFADIEFIQAESYRVDLEWYGEAAQIHYDFDGAALHLWDDPEQYGMNQQPGSVKIYLPQGAAFTSVDAATDSGSIKAGDLNAGLIRLNSEYGDIEARRLQAGQMEILLESGSFNGDGLQADSLSYTNEYGDTQFRNCSFTWLEGKAESGNILLTGCTLGSGTLEADYGDVEATSLASQGLDIDCESGNVDLSGTLGGRTLIKAGYGQVAVTTSLPQQQYDYDLYTEYGALTINGEEVRGGMSRFVNGVASLSVENENGDIDVVFGAASAAPSQSQPNSVLPGQGGSTETPAPAGQSAEDGAAGDNSGVSTPAGNGTDGTPGSAGGQDRSTGGSGNGEEGLAGSANSSPGNNAGQVGGTVDTAPPVQPVAPTAGTEQPLTPPIRVQL